MIDPEDLTFAQLFWLCFFMVLGVLWLCCWTDMNYPTDLIR